jgi:hypothetical protein
MVVCINVLKYGFQYACGRASHTAYAVCGHICGSIYAVYFYWIFYMHIDMDVDNIINKCFSSSRDGSALVVKHWSPCLSFPSSSHDKREFCFIYLSVIRWFSVAEWQPKARGKAYAYKILILWAEHEVQYQIRILRAHTLAAHPYATAWAAF